MPGVSVSFHTIHPFILGCRFLLCATWIALPGTLQAEQKCLFDDPDIPVFSGERCDSPDACCGTAYESCFSSQRSTLTGDWGGLRPQLAESGIQFQADVTNFYMGVVDGGLDRDTRYAGHGDYVLNIDGGKLGIQQGLFVKVRAEHRFGETLGGATGTFLPPAVLADLPVIDEESLYLTNVLITQALSTNFVVFAGKLDTLDGDVNAFAHGRGKTQFSNVAFVASPIVLRTVPYSTLGMGFAWLHQGEPIFNFSVLNPTDTARTSGFDELFAEGVTLAGDLRLPTNFMDLPGHQLFGGSWSSRDYTALGQDPRILLPNVPIAKTSGSWSLYWNFDQYLVVDKCDPTKGWGVFGRAGIADGDSNLIEWFLSFGVGGTSPLPGRSNDGFGAGWYYTGTSGEIGPILPAVLGPIGDGQGVELFYRAQVTPWFHVTPDFQVLIPARENVDTAYVLGIRSNISF